MSDKSEAILMTERSSIHTTLLEPVIEDHANCDLENTFKT